MTLIVNIQRVQQKGLASFGLLSIDSGAMECFTLEDGYRIYKKAGESRIPPGSYELELRRAGGMHERYARRYGDKHRGMLWLKDVPNFEWVYIHTGTTAEDTKGCILVGDMLGADMVLLSSRVAYERIYSRIASSIESGHRARVVLKDENDGLERSYL